MVRFIDAHREDYGVEPICAVLPIAPSTYYEAKARERDATRRSARAQRDTTLMPAIRRVWEATRRRYGAKKVWKELLREGLRVARCTIARLFKAMGLRGVAVDTDAVFFGDAITEFHRVARLGGVAVDLDELLADERLDARAGKIREAGGEKGVDALARTVFN